MKLHVEGFGCQMDGYEWFASGPVRQLKREATEDVKELRKIMSERKKLETIVAQQAAVIEQMREALQYHIAQTRPIFNSIDALTLQPCPEVLNKVRADAVELAAHEAWMSASSDCEDRVKAAVLLLAQRMEQGEA